MQEYELLKILLSFLYHKLIFSISSLIVSNKIFIYSALDTDYATLLSGLGLDLVLH